MSGYPGAIATGSDGNLWFTEVLPPGGTPFSTGPGAIGRITPSGQITEFTRGLSSESVPAGIALGPDGNMWFTDRGAKSYAIGRITPSGQITEFPTGYNYPPNQLTAGRDGNLWFTTVDAIGRITPSGQVSWFTSGLNPHDGPGSITSGPDGNLWFTDDGDTRAIGRITPSGHITEFSSALTSASSPCCITSGPEGKLWFSDDGSPPAIGHATTAGLITESSAGLPPGSVPGEMTLGPDGNLWFVDGGTRSLARITLPASSPQKFEASSPGRRPRHPTITNVNLSQKRHRASFRFGAGSDAIGFRCALVRLGRHGRSHKPSFSPCTSPVTYDHLKPFVYRFEVRARGPFGHGRPASRLFEIR